MVQIYLHYCCKNKCFPQKNVKKARRIEEIETRKFEMHPLVLK
jgi:hypothetical protein